MMRKVLSLACCLGAVLLSPGSFAQSGEPGSPEPASGPRVEVLVYVETRSILIQIEEDGTATRRRGGLERAQLSVVREAVERAESQIAELTGRPVRITLEVDEDLHMAVLRPGQEPSTHPRLRAEGHAYPYLLDEWVAQIQTRVNESPFATDDGRFYGPFDAVFFIDGKLTMSEATISADSWTGTQSHLEQINFYSLRGDDLVAMLAGRLAAPFGASVPELNPTATADGAYSIDITPGLMGPMFRLSEAGLIRTGRVAIPVPGEFDPERHRGLRVTVSRESELGFALFVGDREVVFGEPLRAPVEGGLPGGLRREAVDLPAGQRVTVTIPVDASGLPQVFAGAPSHGRFFERRSPGRAEYVISEIAWVEEAGELPPATASLPRSPFSSFSNPLSAGEVAQLRAALLSDTDANVVLQALGFTSQVAVPELTDLLASLVRAAAPEFSVLARDSLVLIGDEPAIAALTVAASTGPFDWNFRAGAEGLENLVDERHLGVFSAYMARQGWRTRQAGARALANLDSQNADISLISYVVDVEPAVRLAVVQRANPNFELVVRRLQFTAVNDGSEAVRAAAYLRLTEADSPATRNEGFLGVRDESVAIRLAMLDAFTQSPQAEQRPSLRIAVIDRDARVRAAALRAFAQQEGSVEVGEIRPTLTDESAEVLLAVLDLVELGKLEVPAESRDHMLAHSDPRVSQRAQTLLSGEGRERAS